ncbi:MAG: ribose 5-phosphate isomerase B [Desulfuromonas sp.]|mgnify:CR=1 FL=1|uniref:ribose 5-phosphate isomerase B n=1 Tax=Desulfuromonas sp. TaxID=892 RepID=UPI000CC4A1C4|nr:ribose 5-phosphate isomerase B [Desulfuromonas sp.]PLX81899.1 MAG: ribose 5-phosphate isomerase B [Desulfuromonas sp.]
MIIIASDHGGLELKETVKQALQDRGVEVRDLGTMNSDSVDYPDFGAKVAGALARGEADRGILICGTGIGMSIVANKFPGVRAALISDEFTAQMSKEHNNANVIVMGGRVLNSEQACRMVNVWLDTSFEGGRHQKRLDKIAQIEENVRAGRV